MSDVPQSPVITKETVDAINQRLKDMDSRILELENIKAPQNVYGKIESLFQTMDNIQSTVDGLRSKLESYLKGEKSSIEEFTNEQLKAFYVNSGLNQLEAKKYIEKTFFEGKEVSPSTVSRHLNGEIENIKTRSILGKWLRAQCIEKSKQG